MGSNAGLEIWFGLAGTVVPLVPGTILILCGAVLNHFALHSIGWQTLVVLTGMMIVAQARTS